MSTDLYVGNDLVFQDDILPLALHEHHIVPSNCHGNLPLRERESHIKYIFILPACEDSVCRSCVSSCYDRMAYLETDFGSDFGRRI